MFLHIWYLIGLTRITMTQLFLFWTIIKTYYISFNFSPLLRNMWRIRNFWSNLTSSSCPEPSQTSTRWTNIGMTKSTKFLIWMISRADWELFLPKWNVRGMFNAPLLSEPNIVEYILYLQLTCIFLFLTNWVQWGDDAFSSLFILDVAT